LGFLVIFVKKGLLMIAYKPRDYPTVSPYLMVDGASETIQFLVDVFGATELRRFPDASGKLSHAEVRLGDSIIMLADSSESWPSLPANVHIYVQDVDATYQRALEAGAISLQEPIKKADEDKRGGVKDKGGTTWWIATRMD
jgi:PhnB protein